MERGTGPEIVRLAMEHAGELLTLQRAAYVTEAQLCQDPNIPPLTQSLEDLLAELRLPEVTALGAWQGPRLVGGVRLRLAGASAHLGRLIVAPDRQRHGIGSALLAACERVAPPEITEIWLFTEARSTANLRLYERHGYRREREEPAGALRLVHLRKPLPARA